MGSTRGGAQAEAILSPASARSDIAANRVCQGPSAAGNVFPSATTGWRARSWRIGGALLLAVLLAVLFAARADAQPRIKVGCEVYDASYVDPIASTEHLHNQFGNTSTTNQSTGESLSNNKTTTCDQEWWTSAGWFPVEQGEPVENVAVYYRAPGDQTDIQDIPTGLQIVGGDPEYSCGGGPFQGEPPYGCSQEWSTRVVFPDCWDESSLEETTMTMSSNRGFVHLRTRTAYRGSVTSSGMRTRTAWCPTPARVGRGGRVGGLELHARRLLRGKPAGLQQRVAGRPPLRDAPDRGTVADPGCGAGP